MLSCISVSCSGWYITITMSFLTNTGLPDEPCLPYEADYVFPCSEACQDWGERLQAASSWSMVSSDTESLKQSEVDRILGQIDSGKTREVPAMKFVPGDRVKVIDGPFTDFTGAVEEVNPLKSKVKVTVSIFGRPTPVELDVLQIEKVKAGA